MSSSNSKTGGKSLASINGIPPEESDGGGFGTPGEVRGSDDPITPADIAAKHAVGEAKKEALVKKGVEGLGAAGQRNPTKPAEARDLPKR